MIDRLVKALDRAGRAGGLPRGLRIYLTEFGIQSEPDRISGVSLERQPAYYAIAEHMAYVNPRVALFSQYLMRDDQPREEGYRFRGFESGLRRSSGARKPAYRAFPNPLAVERYGSTDVLWGLIRPQRGITQVTVEVRRKGERRWRRLRRLRHHRARRLWAALPVPRRPGVPRPLDLGGRQALHRAADPLIQAGFLTGIVTPRWRRSCGFSVTERPSLTSPSPTPSAS